MHPIHTLRALEDAHTAGTPGAHLVIDSSTLDEVQLLELATSPALECVTQLTLDYAEHNQGIEALMRSAYFTRVHTLTTRSVSWGSYEYSGWSEWGLARFMEESFGPKNPLTTLRCLGDLPDPDDYGGEFDDFGFVLISDWWRGLRVVELDSRWLTDLHVNILNIHDGIQHLRALTLKGTLLTDEIASYFYEHKLSPELEEVVIEGHLLTSKGWDRLCRQPGFPASAHAEFSQRAQRPDKDANELFGNLRSLLQHDIDRALTDVLLNVLEQLRSLDAAHYEDVVLPYLMSGQVAWPERFPVVFGSAFEVVWMERMLKVLPFAEFDLTTDSPDSSCAEWIDLVDSHALERVRSIDSFNHGPTQEEAQGLAESPGLQGLRTLRISTQHLIPAQAICTLLASEHLCNLTALELRLTGYWDSEAGDAIATTIASSAMPLEHLELRGAYLGMAGAQALAMAPKSATLETLKVQYFFDRQRKQARAALAASPYLSKEIREAFTSQE